ncbi:MAG: hypothetical protein R3F62_10380 [Planctomycetota bacterium]
MGLKERRALKAFQDEHFAAQKKRIDDAAGFEVDLDMDWDSLVDPTYLHMINETWPKVYFDPTVAALEAVGVDAMGKEALQEGLKKVVFKNASDCSTAGRCATFSDGVLTVDHKPFTNVDYVKDRAKAIQDVLEDGL